jgi:hypothetical protein
MIILHFLYSKCGEVLGRLNIVQSYYLSYAFHSSKVRTTRQEM